MGLLKSLVWGIGHSIIFDHGGDGALSSPAAPYLTWGKSSGIACHFCLHRYGTGTSAPSDCEDRAWFIMQHRGRIKLTSGRRSERLTP
jgi:hypothetical protein